MVVPTQYSPAGQQRAPSCVDKVKMGFMMGACIGAATGLVLGAAGVMFRPMAGREKLAQIGKIIMGSSGSFGVFMAVGQGIRC